MEKNKVHRDLYRSDRELVLVALGGNALIHACRANELMRPDLVKRG